MAFPAHASLRPVAFSAGPFQPPAFSYGSEVLERPVAFPASTQPNPSAESDVQDFNKTWCALSGFFPMFSYVSPYVQFSPLPLSLKIFAINDFDKSHASNDLHSLLGMPTLLLEMLSQHKKGVGGTRALAHSIIFWRYFGRLAVFSFCRFFLFICVLNNQLLRAFAHGFQASTQAFWAQTCTLHFLQPANLHSTICNKD